MPIPMTCPHCQATGKVPDAAAGKIAKCPRCKGAISVPIPQPVDELDFFSQPEAPIASETFNPFDPTTAALPDDKPAPKRGYRKGDQFNPFEGGAVAPESTEEPTEVIDDGRDPFDYSEPVAPPPPPPPDQALKFGTGPRRR